jgi:hypothetical protein
LRAFNEGGIAMTRILMDQGADTWCRQLGNFTPIAYRPALVSSITQGIALQIADAAPLSARRARWRGMRVGGAASFVFVALILSAMVYPFPAFAQMGGGGMGGMGGHGGRGGSGGRAPDSTQKKDDSVPHAPNPMRAMLSEMRRLRADLLLTSTQIGPWSAMEDALRECVELNRSRLPEMDPGSTIDAQIYVQDLADNQRALAEATDKFAVATKAAFAALNPRQLQTSRERLAGAIAGEQAVPLATQ